MKILKTGKRNYGSFKFKCDKCGCKYEADVNDYKFVKANSNNKYEDSERNEPTDVIMCECPHCNSENIKNIYERNNSSVMFYIYSLSIIINFILCIVIMFRNPNDLDGFIGLMIIFVGIVGIVANSCQNDY